MRGIALETALVCGTLATAQTFIARAALVDQAGIPKHTVEKAQAEATHLAGAGGITLVWVDPNGPFDFAFVVKDCYCGPGKATLGQTLLGDPHRSVYSYIYFDHVVSATHQTDLSTGYLLGYSIAHELGHLLGLNHVREGILNHVREGIMMPNWTGQQLALMARRGMRFSQAEAHAMQTEIGARRMLQHDDSDRVADAANKHPLQ